MLGIKFPHSKFDSLRTISSYEIRAYKLTLESNRIRPISKSCCLCYCPRVLPLIVLEDAEAACSYDGKSESLFYLPWAAQAQAQGKEEFYFIYLFYFHISHPCDLSSEHQLLLNTLFQMFD